MLKMLIILGFMPLYRQNIACFVANGDSRISLNKCLKIPFYIAQRAIYCPIWSPRSDVTGPSGKRFSQSAVWPCHWFGLSRTRRAVRVRIVHPVFRILS